MLLHKISPSIPMNAVLPIYIALNSSSDNINKDFSFRKSLALLTSLFSFDVSHDEQLWLKNFNRLILGLLFSCLSMDLDESLWTWKDLIEGHYPNQLARNDKEMASDIELKKLLV